MMYQIHYKYEGMNFVKEANTESFKNDFITILERAGIAYGVICRDDRKIQLCKVAFSLEDAVAVKAGLKAPYTFADPDKHGCRNAIVTVQLESGEQKTAFVCDTKMATIAEIKELAEKLGRKKLCRVIRKVA